MKAHILRKIVNLDINRNPLELVELPIPIPAKNEVLIKISCCGVCHTELDEIEGRLTIPTFPIIPGHQIIGTIEQLGPTAKHFKNGDRVGVAWIFSSCEQCDYCNNGMENLCEHFKATGLDANGGYAQYITISENYIYSIPKNLSDTEAAPLLCAGAIGYRSLRLTNIANGETLGLMGFGASGHLVLKMSMHLFPESKIFVYTRDEEQKKFALSLGANWAGDIDDTAPEKAKAIIDTTPAWRPILESLNHIKPGGRLVINAIRKEEKDKAILLDLNYTKHLWLEKEIKTVANITRKDVKDFLKITEQISIKPEVEIYPFDQANNALIDLKQKHIRGAKVLKMN